MLNVRSAGSRVFLTKSVFLSNGVTDTEDEFSTVVCLIRAFANEPAGRSACVLLKDFHDLSEGLNYPANMVSAWSLIHRC